MWPQVLLSLGSVSSPVKEGTGPEVIKFILDPSGPFTHLLIPHTFPAFPSYITGMATRQASDTRSLFGDRSNQAGL